MKLRSILVVAVGLMGSIYPLAGPVSAAGPGFQPFISLNAGVSPRGIAVGNVFGPGRTGLVVADFGSSTFIGRSTPATVLSSGRSQLRIFSPSPVGLRLVSTVATASSPRGLFLAGLDGTGQDAIWVTGYDADLLQVFEWRGGGFQKVAEKPTLKMPVGVAVGATRSGGVSFAAVADYGANSLSLFPLKGGSLGEGVTIATDPGPAQVALGDLDGDGFNEMAVACLASDKIDVFSVKSDDPASYRLSQTLPLPEGGAPSDLRLADLNGDGRTDMVVADFTKNEIWIYLQQADGSLAAPLPLPTSGSHPNGLTVADLYGNGREEIIVANRDSDSLDVFEWANGRFGLSRTLKVADDPGASFGPVEVAAMDTRGRGQMDLVASHMRSDSIKVLAQVEAPTPTPSIGVETSAAASFSGETTFCYPNPTRDGRTKFRFMLASPAPVEIQVFDVLGERVWAWTLPASRTQEGVNSVDWQGLNQAGSPLASGLYLYRITTGGKAVTKKVAIVR